MNPNDLFLKPFAFLKKILWSKAALGIIGILALLALLRNVELPGLDIGIPISQEWLIGSALIIVIIALLPFWRRTWGFIFFLGITTLAYIAFTNTGAQLAVDAGVSLKKLADSSIEYDLRIENLDGTEAIIPDIRAGDYKVEFFPVDTIYAIRCSTGGQLEFYFRADDRENPSSDSMRGTLLAKGSATKVEFSKSHGGTIRIGDDKKVVFLFKFGPTFGFGNKDVDSDCAELIPPEKIRVLLTRK